MKHIHHRSRFLLVSIPLIRSRQRHYNSALMSRQIPSSGPQYLRGPAAVTRPARSRSLCSSNTPFSLVPQWDSLKQTCCVDVGPIVGPPPPSRTTWARSLPFLGRRQPRLALLHRQFSRGLHGACTGLARGMQIWYARGRIIIVLQPHAVVLMLASLSSSRKLTVSH